MKKKWREVKKEEMQESQYCGKDKQETYTNKCTIVQTGELYFVYQHSCKKTGGGILIFNFPD